MTLIVATLSTSTYSIKSIVILDFVNILKPICWIKAYWVIFDGDPLAQSVSLLLFSQQNQSDS